MCQYARFPASVEKLAHSETVLERGLFDSICRDPFFENAMFRYRPARVFGSGLLLSRFVTAVSRLATETSRFATGSQSCANPAKPHSQHTALLTHP
jgi:hypothetical protein